MALTTAERTSIINLTVGMFNAAPGATFLAELTVAFEANGRSLTNLALDLAKTTAYTTLNPVFQTASEFAAAFLTPLGLQANTEAVAFITDRFNAGASKGQIVAEAIAALNATTAPAFADAKAILTNKTTVAEHYSVTLAKAVTDITALQTAISTVTADPATVAAAQTANDTSSAAQTFTLTTGTDSFVGTSNNETFNAGVAAVIDPATGNQNNVDTSQTVDTLNGGAGIDTLNLTTKGGTVALPSLSGIEIINAKSLANLTINTSAVADVTKLNVTEAAGAVTATAAATADVSATVKSDAVTVQGGKNVAVTLTAANAGDNIVVGSTAAAAGTVTVNATSAAAANGGDFTMGTVGVTGGTTIAVTQKTGDASALVAAGATATHTQGAITATGNAATTTVTIKQDAAVTAVAGTVAVAAATEVASVKFVAAAANDVITVGGLTFTASKALTANEVAQAFANLSATAAKPGAATGDTQGSGIVANGVFTGSVAAAAAFNSGVASGDTVVFTADKAGAIADLTATGATVTVTTQGVTAVTAVAPKLGVVAGQVTVANSAAMKTVSVDGFSATGSAITGTSTVLDTLTLANGGAFTVSNNAATLALNLEKVGGTITFTAAPTTLNIKSIGNNTIGTLTAAATEALNVSGTGTLSAVTTSDLTATKAIKVTETAGLNLTGATLTNLTSVDSTGTTGALTITIDGTKTTYAGGAGKDTVTLATGTALTKAIDLGAGDDTLSFAALGVTGSTAAVAGGGGTDTLSMSTATAAALDAAVQTFYTGFERLTLNDAGAASTIDLANLGFTNYVTTTGSAGTLTLDKLASNGTVVLTTAPTTGVTVQVTDAATGTADVLNLVLSSAGNLAAGLLTAANVETINISAVDTEVVTAPAVQTKNVNSLTLTADKATSVSVVGGQDLTLTLTGSTKVTSIDGSAMTGGLTVTSLNNTAATTIKGGSGNDVLTAATGTTADVLIGGAGNDTLTGNTGLTTLTGGAGNDLFVVGTASLNVNSYATITDFAAGDLIKFTGADSFQASKVTLGGTAVFQDFANAAMNAVGVDDAAWFQFGGDTYIVMDVGADSTTFNNGQDFIVKLTGLVDLSNASFNNDFDTIALV